ncbi:MAG: peptidoglycan-associated lipoprotein, partial [Pseudomonadota bacterium]|nr:peptidoglycan-associated lipoprotein [Pseudomonadota bacterium]
LRTHAERLRDDPRLVVTLVGHTDHLGSRSFNLAIAEQRTTAVKTKLRELGVPAKQVRQRNYGNEKAAAGCRSEECRARMRRVDFVYPTLRQK